MGVADAGGTGFAHVGIVGLNPDNRLVSAAAELVVGGGGLAGAAVLNARENVVGILVLGHAHTLGVGVDISAADAVQNFAVGKQILAIGGLVVLCRLVEGVCPELRENAAVCFGLDMLCSIKTEAVNAAVDAFLEQRIDLVLHKAVAGVEVGTGRNMSAGHHLGRAVGGVVSFTVEIGAVVVVDLRLIGLDLIAETVGVNLIIGDLVVCHVVGNDIHDNLDAVFVSLLTQCCQLSLVAEPCVV